jgi:hypothetical protein
MEAIVLERPVRRWALAGLWLVVLLIPGVFHGCHPGGHDDDLLKIRIECQSTWAPY